MFFSNLLHKISAERIGTEDPFLSPFFYQQQRAYTFCRKFAKGKNVLEVGSGSGYGAYRLSKIAESVLGIDKDKITINKSKEKYKRDNLKFLCSKIEDCKNEDKFDAIIALQVLEHIEKPETFLNKIIFKLKKDGLFILSTPNGETQSYNENPYHYKEYSFDELKDMLSYYFNKVEMYSLYGDRKIKEFEEMRKSYVLSVLEKDIFRIRMFIPRVLKQRIFDAITLTSRIIYRKNNEKFNDNIKEGNYMISKRKISDAIDIIAVCKYPKL